MPKTDFQRYKNSGFYEFKDVDDHIDGFLNQNEPDHQNKYFIAAENTSETFEQFKRHFIYIEAAGGLVVNEEHEILTMFRRGMNDLPKGKCEQDESVEQTALREVEEECGVQNLVLDSLITATYHIYPYKGSYALKKTWWYNMHAPKQSLQPETAEDITAVDWLPVEQIDEFTVNTYPTLVEVLEKAGILMSS